jgi:hypothetical protein
MVDVLLWYVWMCSDFSGTLFGSSVSLVYIVMAPRGRKPCSSTVGLS